MSGAGSAAPEVGVMASKSVLGAASELPCAVLELRGMPGSRSVGCLGDLPLIGPAVFASLIEFTSVLTTTFVALTSLSCAFDVKAQLISGVTLDVAGAPANVFASFERDWGWRGDWGRGEGASPPRSMLQRESCLGSGGLGGRFFTLLFRLD